jgi:hypothetical protein
MNKETKKIRLEFVEQCWSPSEDITSVYYDCWDAGHATAMKDVGELVEVLNRITDWSVASNMKKEILSCFIQNQTEKDPTPWCSACGAMRANNCECGPIAENE